MAKRALTVDDLFDMRWLQAGRLSPDGRRVVYVVSHIERGEAPDGSGAASAWAGKTDAGGKPGPEDKEHCTLFLYADGSTRQMTSGTHKDTHPAWSPDGATIAFLSDREGKPQIFLLPVDGGEARRLSRLKQGAGAPRWSPDGKQIAFAAGFDYGEKDPPDRSKDPYRVTRNVWRFDAIGDLDLSVQNLHVMDVASGEVRKLTDHNGRVGGIRWSPDGSRILYSVTMLPDRWAGMQSIHYVITPKGESIYEIPDRPTFGGGEWLPDGKRILFQGVESEDTPIGTHPDLWIYDPAAGALENRTDGMELALGGTLEARMPAHQQNETPAVVSPDGAWAYVQVQRSGRVGIHRISLRGESACEQIVDGDRACYLYDSVGDSILFSAADINDPPDLYTTSLTGAGERRLSELNATLLATIAMPSFRELWFRGTDGVEVNGWFVLPAAAGDAEPAKLGAPAEGTTPPGAPYPTILWIHGGPHGAQGHQFAFDTHLLSGAGYAVLYVNHRASTGYGDSFSTAIHADWGNLDYGDLMAGVDHAVAQGLADSERLGCCGISGGGNLSCWIVGNTDRFKAAVPQNPVTSWRSFYGVSDIGVWFSRKQLGGDPHEIPEVYDRCSPISYAHNCTTPTLIIQCEDDFRCPAEQSEQFYTVLRANGCTVEMLRQPGGSHGGSVRGPLPLRTAHLRAKLDWFGKHIPAQGLADREGS